MRHSKKMLLLTWWKVRNFSRPEFPFDENQNLRIVAVQGVEFLQLFPGAQSLDSSLKSFELITNSSPKW